MTKTLSKPAQEIINNYLHLPFGNKNVSCPYFNNKKSGARAALRVMIGKGSVEDIVQEIMLIGFREKLELEKMTNEQLKKVLVDHNIGIDCSGIAYYILEAEVQSIKKHKFKNKLKYPYIKNPLRKLLTKLRPVESTNVKTLFHDKNSKEVSLRNIQPGDMIIMIKSGQKQDRDHILIVHKVEYDKDENPTAIYYTHSLNWSTDGIYNHGVRQGVITITDINKNIEKQSWEENRITGEKNETQMRAETAKTLQIKRLNILN
jgi:hypothetical protein